MNLRTALENQCRHFNGVGSGTCAAGCVFDDVADWTAETPRLPCFRDGADLPCDKRSFRTEEEIVAEIARLEPYLARCFRARNNVAAFIKATNFTESRGSILCPNCQRGNVDFSIGSSGRIAGRCSVRGCCHWL